MPAAGIEWNQGWPRIEALIGRMISTLEAGTPLHFTPDDYLSIYRCCQLCQTSMVYEKVKHQVGVATLSMIHQEREGNLIDGALLKNVLDIYVSVGAGSMKFYEQDFEMPMLSNTALYYSQKAAKWILADSFTDYMHKANECVKQEEDRALKYFQSRSKQKLLESVYHELFVVHARLLEEKRLTESLSSDIIEVEINQSLVQRYERLNL